MPTTLRHKKLAKKAATDANPQFLKGSGNVFRDLGLPNPDLLLAKATLVQHIRDLIEQRKLTQAKAAALLGLDQPKISALVRGRTDGYSIDRLFKFLNLLGHDVEIRVRPSANDTAETRISE